MQPTCCNLPLYVVHNIDGSLKTEIPVTDAQYSITTSPNPDVYQKCNFGLPRREYGKLHY